MSNRQSNRVVAAIGIIIEIDGKSHPCLTGNISSGGLYVMLKHKVAAGTTVVLLVPEGQKRLRTKAMIASNDGIGIGISFPDADQEFLQHWTRLLRKLLRRATQDLGASFDASSGQLAWATLPDGRFWTFLKKRLHKDRLVNLTLDGAAFQNKNPPGVGETVLIFLNQIEDGQRQELHCQAEVVRHTDNGFAVRFETPRIEFRRALSRLRQAVALD